MTTEKERMQILEMVEKGQISAEDGVRLLNVLSPGEELDGIPASIDVSPEDWVESYPETSELSNKSTSAARQFTVDSDVPVDGDEFSKQGVVEHGEVIESDPTKSALPLDALKWKSWWAIPLWIGVAITISGGFLMYTAMENSGIGLYFFCAGVPFIIGLLLMVLAWQSRVAPWLHLRVQQRPGQRPQRIAFSFPIPIRPTVWLARTFGRNVKEINNVPLDEMLLAVGETAKQENPIYIQVDEGDEGEKVEIYIG